MMSHDCWASVIILLLIYSYDEAAQNILWTTDLACVYTLFGRRHNVIGITYYKVNPGDVICYTTLL